MSEQALTRAIVDRLNIAPGVVAWRNNTGVARIRGSHVRYGLGVGSADVIACVEGRFVGIEVKLPKGEGASGDQLAWMGEVRRQGGFACVVRSVEEALAAVERARRGERCLRRFSR